MSNSTRLSLEFGATLVTNPPSNRVWNGTVHFLWREGVKNVINNSVNYLNKALIRIITSQLN